MRDGGGVEVVHLHGQGVVELLGAEWLHRKLVRRGCLGDRDICIGCVAGEGRGSERTSVEQCWWGEHLRILDRKGSVGDGKATSTSSFSTDWNWANCNMGIQLNVRTHQFRWSGKGW